MHLVLFWANLNFYRLHFWNPNEILNQIPNLWSQQMFYLNLFFNLVNLSSYYRKHKGDKNLRVTYGTGIDPLRPWSFFAVHHYFRDIFLTQAGIFSSAIVATVPFSRRRLEGVLKFFSLPIPESKERFRDSPEKYFCGPPDIRYTVKNGQILNCRFLGPWLW